MAKTYRSAIIDNLRFLGLVGVFDPRLSVIGIASEVELVYQEANFCKVQRDAVSLLYTSDMVRNPERLKEVIYEEGNKRGGSGEDLEILDYLESNKDPRRRPDILRKYSQPAKGDRATFEEAVTIVTRRDLAFLAREKLLSDSVCAFLTHILSFGGDCRHGRVRVSHAITLDTLKGALSFLNEFAKLRLRDPTSLCYWCDKRWNWTFEHVFDASLGSVLKERCWHCGEELVPDIYQDAEIRVPNLPDRCPDVGLFADWIGASFPDGARGKQSSDSRDQLYRFARDLGCNGTW